jgi:hypothetical protein
MAGPGKAKTDLTQSGSSKPLLSRLFEVAEGQGGEGRILKQIS